MFAVGGMFYPPGAALLSSLDLLTPMAITTNASYVPTLTEFIGHWTDVNTDRGAAGPLVLGSGADVAQARMWRSQLQGLEAELQSRLNDREIARGHIRVLKERLNYWFSRWAGIFDAYFAEGPWRDARPKSPAISSTVEDFLVPMLDVVDLWKRFNVLTGPAKPPGLPLPIVLLGETYMDALTVAQFETLIVDLRAQADAETLAAGRARRTRSKRAFCQDKAYAVMKMYRQAMPQALPSESDLQATLPRLTPEETGPAPAPVNASAVHVIEAQSRTTYDASPAPDLKEYQLRGVIGEEWDEDDAVTIATNGPEAPREFTVNFGLTQPGTSIVLKVYVITEPGRERGSAPLRVDRV